METKILALVTLAIAIASASARISASHGIANLRISLSGSNVVLFWPSLTNQAFYIQYAPDLNPGTPWTTLAANYPAVAGTNWTSFTHSNSVTYPGPCGTNSGGGSFDGPPGFSMVAVQTDQGTLFLTQAGGELTVEDVLPYPWNPRFAPPPPPLPGQRSTAMQSAQLDSNAGSSGAMMTNQSGCPPTMGFYRVFIPAPRANGDVFSVAQGSTMNQLSILANDSDPEEGLFLLSNAVAAAHGNIQYVLNADIFWCTPTNGFWGVDAFSYALTNDIGGLAGTNVCVFVDKTGNNNPSAPSLLLTLASNQTQITFIALTNATDSDGNPLFVRLLFQPAHGTAVTNVDGTITYAADTNRIALDSFTYVIADTNGGMVQRTVGIVPQDSDSDGIPDAWEMQYGLNPTVSDYNSDPDADEVKSIAEYRLGTDPLVAQSPLTLSLVSNSVVSGFVSFPLPGVNSEIDTEALTLYVNSAPAANSFLSQRADGQWQLHWDTLFTTNGAYSLKARFQYSVGGITNITFGPQTTVVVSNQLWVNPITRGFTDFVLLDYQLATSDANYHIDLYDDYGTPWFTQKARPPMGESTCPGI